MNFNSIIKKSIEREAMLVGADVKAATVPI